MAKEKDTEGSAKRLAAFDAMVEVYTKQNPAKAAAKKEEFARKRAAIK